RPLPDRVRQRPRVGAHRAAADDDRATDSADGLRGGRAARRPDRAARRPGDAADAADAAGRSRFLRTPGKRRVTITRVEEAGPAYRDPARPLAERVGDLLGRMTREEKIAQLGSAWVVQLADGATLSTERA